MARDAETGRIGTYQAQFVIPNLNKVLKRVPISSVVLSGQQVNVKDALYSTMKSKDAAKNDAANPLVQDGMKLIPSVTRVFAVDREFTVYLQAYVGSNVTPPSNHADCKLRSANSGAADRNAKLLSRSDEGDGTPGGGVQACSGNGTGHCAAAFRNCCGNVESRAV